MDLALREITCGPCPYLGEREWRIKEFSSPSFSPGLYEDLLAQGFRRSGMSFYRNTCDACGLCIPIRLDGESFEPSRSQRRLARLNADLSVALLPNDPTPERFELYERYRLARHRRAGASARSSLAERFSDYASFLLESPLSTSMVTDYRLPDGSLAATGYLDLLPGGLSSVYFAFEPSLSSRSLGTWSVLREVELARSLGKRWYYLGFWVPGSPKMDYKARFEPFEYAREGTWSGPCRRGEVLAALGAA